MAVVASFSKVSVSSENDHRFLLFSCRCKVKTQRKVRSFDETDMKTYSYRPGLRSYLKKEIRPKCLTMPEKSSKEINILGYGLAVAFTYSEFFFLPWFSLPASAIGWAIKSVHQIGWARHVLMPRNISAPTLSHK